MSTAGSAGVASAGPAASAGAAARAGTAASAGASAGDIRARIASGYGVLSPQEQKAADFIVEHLDDLAVYSATEIAAASAVSKATVSRLFRRLGFADAAEVRDQARSLRNRGVPVGASGDLLAHLAAEHANLEAMLRNIDGGVLEAAAAAIAQASRVVVVGFRNSYPVALHLRQQLAQARAAVQLAPAPGQSLAEELAGLEARDTVVLVGFRRRPAGFESVLAALIEHRIPTVLLTESEGRGDASTVTRLVAPIGSPSPFDSYAAAMSLANLLASAVLDAGGRGSRARVADITGLYDELGELE